MTGEPLVVVGVGLDGAASLRPEARAAFASAQVVAGAKRHLALFPEFPGERLLLDGDMPSWIEKLKARDRRKKAVLLATGDPLFFGIGRLLLDAFPRAELQFVPGVSSIALAFTRVKESWHDACVVSLHGRPLRTLLSACERREVKIAIFTDADNHPAAIAQLLCERGFGRDYVAWVCENLGGDEERVTRWSLPELRDAFSPLNVVVLLRTSEARSTLPILGLPETAFRHRDGLITKRAVRLQALCCLELRHGDVFWDIGAGSGSVSIEAARLSPSLSAYAIERATDELRENLERFGLANVHLVAGEAPECVASLPDPDAVFVGGSGGRLIEILDDATRRLKPGGRLVVSCVTLETLTRAWSWLSEHTLDPQATSVQFAQSRPMSTATLHRLEPDNPITLVRITKP